MKNVYQVNFYDSGTPIYGHPINTDTCGYITDSFVCPNKKFTHFL